MVKLKNNLRFKRDIPFWLLALPGIVYLLLFNYLPMIGLVLAFKRYNYIDGMIHSPWVEDVWENFRFFFNSVDATRVTVNTIGYNVIFIITVNFSAVVMALLLFEIHRRWVIKYVQTVMLLPYFISWVVVAYIFYSLLHPNYGVFNQIITALGGKPILWYTEPKHWIWILPLANLWKNIGMNCLIVYAALMAIDISLFEAAELDGAGRFRQIIHVSLPSIIPVMVILLILSVGGIMRGDFGLFYQVPMDTGLLYPTTDVIDTFIYRGLREGNMSLGTAAGLFQSVVGLVMVLITNYIVKKINPENSMF